MKKVYIIIIPIIALVISTAFMTTSSTDNSSAMNDSSTMNDSRGITYTVPSKEEMFQLGLGKTFIAFKEAIGFKESQGKYYMINTLGYLGKYQFGSSTLRFYGVTNTLDFLHNPALQERIFLMNCAYNKWALRKDIKRSVGKRINGVVITESGILAAAHLAGSGGVKKFLHSFGKSEARDAYGSSITHYMKQFAGYDTSWVVAEKSPRL